MQLEPCALHRPSVQEPPQEGEQPAAAEPQQLAVEYGPEDLPSDEEVLVRAGLGEASCRLYRSLCVSS